ncbi:uncharacterized protein LOC126801257 [Argentina anserina]|uniref:uncharacterized protein LOC126801257 n=1 Tax=Argentina anserina TaxID=57926 RepID=UPI00217672FA|nr:uncharacterized protein LOC126801257 [Potentilla anserina]XP_050384712.1 uncharacterized protein LOC126801257 [Potentilla anserina]XP_050384713.1 uncharacterized protein LOC126801257 [Potentilla anserina]
MEEGIKGDYKLSRGIGSFKSTLSGRSSPRNSPSFKRLHSSRTPRREARSSGGAQWFRSNRLLFWLLLITLWAYLGFYFQSSWAHSNNKDNFLGVGNEESNEKADAEQIQRRDLLDSPAALKNETGQNQTEADKSIGVGLAKKDNGAASRRSLSAKKKSKKTARGKARGKPKKSVPVEIHEMEEQEPDIPKTNASYGMLVGPFGSTEDRILEWSPRIRSGTCDRKGDFARLVWSRRFMLIFHELSMTGAPLSMMELATELLSCGATVSAVVLSKKGGLMPELTRRKIKVLEDKADHSFKTAMKQDLVIAGSAVCASWIDQYIDKFPAGASQIAWWIMENRREYFDRAKVVLGQVKMLAFLSESQSKQWLDWCEEEKIKLREKPAIVPLSINDELAFSAGIGCSLNTPASSTEKMLEKMKLLRDAVRKEMGLTDNDMLAISLSSINPGKGQLLVLNSARLVIEEPQPDNPKIKNSVRKGRAHSALGRKHHSRSLLQRFNDHAVSLKGFPLSTKSSVHFKEYRKKQLHLRNRFASVDELNASNFIVTHKRKVLSDNGGTVKQSAKFLIGSVGSKSNKVAYVKELLSFLSQHSNLSKSVLWTPATTRVASLYSAADVYVMNSQGLGETFGRVTIEAMAFGLPVLGTDAGGTKEIVDHNVTGLLHPLGHPGTQVLAKNLRLLLKNPELRKQMGLKGREKVEKMYLKRHMYKKFVEVLLKCMRPK